VESVKGTTEVNIEVRTRNKRREARRVTRLLYLEKALHLQGYPSSLPYEVNTGAGPDTFLNVNMYWEEGMARARACSDARETFAVYVSPSK